MKQVYKLRTAGEFVKSTTGTDLEFATITEAEEHFKTHETLKEAEFVLVLQRPSPVAEPEVN